jgi:molybdopterin/thiamine biosynthesis adenylyltransferase
MTITTKPVSSSRYTRHEEFITVSHQNVLANARVLLAGCGVGSTLAPNLARLGYATNKPGCLIMADPDIVEVTNLNRQAFPEEAVGKNKAQALKNEVDRINSKVNMIAVTEGVTLQNVSQLVSSADIIVDMIDVATPEVMIALHREAEKQKRPVITGFDLGEGTATLFFNYRDPNTIRLDRYLGLENVHMDELSEFSSIASTALAAQCLIGPVLRVFADSDEAQRYYMDFFNSKNINTLKEITPEEMHSVIDKISSGELDYIPQMNTASVTLGNVHEVIIRNILINNYVKTAPEIIWTDMKSLIRPETLKKRGQYGKI